jgi:hypothetical protein
MRVSGELDQRDSSGLERWPPGETCAGAAAAASGHESIRRIGLASAWDGRLQPPIPKTRMQRRSPGFMAGEAHSMRCSGQCIERLDLDPRQR